MPDTTQTNDQIRDTLLADIGVELRRWDGTDDDPQIAGCVVKRATQDGTNGTFTVLTVDDMVKPPRRVEVACFWRLSEMVEQYDPQPGDYVGIRWWDDEQSKNDKLIRNYTASVRNADGTPKAPVDNGDTQASGELVAEAVNPDEDAAGDSAGNEAEEPF